MKSIKFFRQYQADIILALAVVLISITAFNLGKISTTNKQKTPITIMEPTGVVDKETKTGTNIQKLGAENRKPEATIAVIASKNSTTKVYHFPWCPSASKIADKNKITFATEAAAISAGYTLAGNCLK